MDNAILIIDDSPTQRAEILNVLKRENPAGRFLEAVDGISGLKQALEHPLDLILCDLEMPGLDGFKFLAMKNAQERLQDVPVIILTGHDRQEIKTRGLEQGASDYLIKPFDPGELLARVRIQLKIKHLQDELRHRNELLHQLAITDPLTGLANRRSLMESSRREFERTQRSGTSLALVMLDLDHFKRINDTYGHQRGDEVLAAVAKRLKEGVRPYDLAARYGGEEFALLLPDTRAEEAALIAERHRTTLNQLRFDGELRNLRVSASFGVAASPGPGVAALEDLFRIADAALYQAKEQGRNRVALLAE